MIPWLFVKQTMNLVGSFGKGKRPTWGQLISPGGTGGGVVPGGLGGPGGPGGPGGLGKLPSDMQCRPSNKCPSSHLYMMMSSKPFCNIEFPGQKAKKSLSSSYLAHTLSFSSQLWLIVMQSLGDVCSMQCRVGPWKTYSVGQVYATEVPNAASQMWYIWQKWGSEEEICSIEARQRITNSPGK